jgi:hypothetical protein
MPIFQPGQSLSFQVDRPAEITFIQFADFHAEDADKAELRIGAESFVIHGSDVSYGMWRSAAPLHIKPEDVIALVALAPTDEELKVAEEARAERLDEFAEEGEDRPATPTSSHSPYIPFTAKVPSVTVSQNQRTAKVALARSDKMRLSTPPPMRQFRTLRRAYWKAASSARAGCTNP